MGFKNEILRPKIVLILTILCLDHDCGELSPTNLLLQFHETVSSPLI